MRRALAPWPPALAALLLLGLGVGCAHDRPAAAAVRPSPQVGRPLELKVPDLSGRLVDVAAEQGKVRLVDFWATWCEPCRDALPVLDRLSRELGPRGLSVYAVAFDEDPALIPPFLAQVPVSFPVLVDKGGEVLTSRFLVTRLPTTLLVDRRGIIRFVHEGWTPERAREEQRLVEQLLAEP